ncbi:MAG: A/G-specific adenine glycosylase, partial [candidate division GAL15 bacterium]
EVMLQQTRVVAAIPYYRAFLRAFPTVRALASATQQQVLRVWAGLGYYARARHLLRAARQIVRRGDFPTSAREWRTLPGVGPYTAAAVASIALWECDCWALRARPGTPQSVARCSRRFRRCCPLAVRASLTRP